MAAQQVNPIQLPPPSAVRLPPAPQNPPNDEDFYNAIQYQERVRNAIAMDLVGPTVLREASTYKNAIHTRITQGANIAPPWAIQLFQQTNQNINARFDEIENQIYELTVEAGEHFDRVGQRLSRVETMAARAHNMAASDGHAIPFEEVPFVNGHLPSLYADLPILTNVTVISGLTGQQATEYFQNYFPGTPVPHMIVDRKKAICRAIGCHQALH